MKTKSKWLDNVVIYLLVTVVMAFGGQIFGAILVNIPVGFYAGFRSVSTGNSIADEVSNLSDAVTTGMMYGMFIGIWILGILWCLKKNNRPIFTAMSTKVKGNNIVKFLIGIVIGGGLNGLCILAAYLHGDIKLYFDSFRPVSLVIIFLLVLVQSSAEEFICRGYLMQKMLHRYKNPWIGMIGNAVLFSLLHIFNEGVGPLALINIVLCGILFSFIVYFMDSFWAACAAHAAWNFTQNILFGLPNSGNVVPYSVMKLDASTAYDSFAYNVAFGVEATVLAAVLLIVSCVAIGLWGIKTGKKITNVWPEEVTTTTEEAATEQENAAE